MLDSIHTADAKTRLTIDLRTHLGTDFEYGYGHGYGYGYGCPTSALSWVKSRTQGRAFIGKGKGNAPR